MELHGSYKVAWNIFDWHGMFESKPGPTHKTYSTLQAVFDNYVNLSLHLSAFEFPIDIFHNDHPSILDPPAYLTLSFDLS